MGTWKDKNYTMMLYSIWLNDELHLHLAYLGHYMWSNYNYIPLKRYELYIKDDIYLSWSMCMNVCN